MNILHPIDGFLDSRHSGVPFRNIGAPVLHFDNPPVITTDDRRRELDRLQWMNRRQSDALGDPEIASRIASYELAFRVQASRDRFAQPALQRLRYCLTRFPELSARQNIVGVYRRNKASARPLPCATSSRQATDTAYAQTPS